MNTPLSGTLGWRICRHAHAKASLRAVSTREILETIAAPERTYRAEHYGDGRWVYQRDQIALAVHPASKYVITVLWNHAGRWTDNQFAARHTDLSSKQEIG